MIDKMVTHDCHRGKRNLSMAWVDVKNDYPLIRSQVPKRDYGITLVPQLAL